MKNKPTFDDHFKDIEFLKKLCDTHEKPRITCQEIVRYLESNLQGRVFRDEDMWEALVTAISHIGQLTGKLNSVEERLEKLEDQK